MPDRLSPGTFLSLMRHPRTGVPLYDAPLPPSEDESAPRDCVREFPTLTADVAQLVGYDVNGVPRIKIELPRADVGWWEMLIIRYVRWRFGRPIQLVR